MLRERTVLAVLQQQIVTTAVSGERNGVPPSLCEKNYDEVMKLKGIRNEKGFEISPIKRVD
jgi:hypothetical protein